MIELSALVIYPVKSCAGITLEQSAFGPDGLLHDREFLVVDENGTFMTQRGLPRMALVRTALCEDALVLSAPSLPELRVPWHPADRGAERTVTVWRDTVQAVDAGEEAAEWMTATLERSCRLVRRGDGYRRVLREKRVPASLGGDGREFPVSFADAFPMLVVSEESLADLNDRLDDMLPMNRFRPNLVLRGCQTAFEEDRWTTFRIGERALFHAGGACERCNVPTIDQDTGTPQGKEPLRTLATYRRNPHGSGVIFGQNVVPEGNGTLRVGDAVQVLS